MPATPRLRGESVPTATDGVICFGGFASSVFVCSVFLEFLPINSHPFIRELLNMNRKFLFALTVLIAVSLGFVGQARSGVIDTTFGAWAQGPVQDDDKLYTLLGTDIKSTIPITFSSASLASTDIHSVFFRASDGIWGLAGTAGSFFVEYTVEIILGDKYFRDVQLDSTIGSSGVSVTKEVRDASDNLLLPPLTSTDGSSVLPTAIPGPPLKKLKIRENLTIDPNGFLTSVQNTYTQAVVPEPASIVSFGGLALLMGVVMMRRRKRA